MPTDMQSCSGLRRIEVRACGCRQSTGSCKDAFTLKRRLLEVKSMLERRYKMMESRQSPRRTRRASEDGVVRPSAAKRPMTSFPFLQGKCPRPHPPVSGSRCERYRDEEAVPGVPPASSKSAVVFVIVLDPGNQCPSNALVITSGRHVEPVHLGA